MTKSIQGWKVRTRDWYERFNNLENTGMIEWAWNNIFALNKWFPDSSETWFLRERAERVRRRALLLFLLAFFLLFNDCLSVKSKWQFIFVFLQNWTSAIKLLTIFATINTLNNYCRAPPEHSWIPDYVSNHFLKVFVQNNLKQIFFQYK